METQAYRNRGRQVERRIDTERQRSVDRGRQRRRNVERQAQPDGAVEFDLGIRIIPRDFVDARKSHRRAEILCVDRDIDDAQGRGVDIQECRSGVAKNLEAAGACARGAKRGVTGLLEHQRGERAGQANFDVL